MIEVPRIAAIYAQRSSEIDEEDWDTLRDEFYTRFKVSFLEQTDNKSVVALIPDGMYNLTISFFKELNMKLKDARVHIELLENIK